MTFTDQRAEIEKHIIGSLFLGECRRWREIDNHEAFAHPVYRRVWKSAIDLCRKGVYPMPTMAVNAAGYSDEERKKIMPDSALADAMNHAVTDVNLDWWMTRLSDLITEEKLSGVRAKAEERLKLGDDPEAVLLWVKEQEDQIKAGTEESVLRASMAGSCDRVIETALKGEAPQGLIYTGLKPLDYLSGGILPGEYVVLAARPSCGKTSLALNVMVELARQGMKTVFFSLEMSRDMIAASITAIVSQVSARRLLREAHRLSYMEKQQISAHREQVSRLSSLIHVYATPGMKAREMEKIARREVATGAKVAFMDHVQLTTEQGENESLRIGAFSKAWNRIAKENAVPCVALCQLNRDSVKQEREPKPSDLKQSGSLEEDADIIWFIHPPKGIIKGEREKVRLIQAKGRTCGVGCSQAWFNGPTQTFSGVEEDVA